MIQSGMLFSKYGINIFEFAEINDFLLAAFREPLPILAALGVIAYTGIVFSILYRRQKARGIEKPKLFRTTTMTINLIVSALIMPLLIQFFVAETDRSGLLSSDYQREVSISLRRGNLPGIENINDTTLQLIGSSENFVFLYETNSNRPLIVPTSNLVGIAIKP
ncbi:hypothetical protein ACX03_19750 [Vibrio parahaemolyticus]|nr:hypothetical protein ACX03_19750 [Vibrio parahaemolyticus]